MTHTEDYDETRTAAASVTQKYKRTLKNLGTLKGQTITDKIDTTPEAVSQHLDTRHNHEAGLIPMSTQTMMRAMSDRIEELEAAIRRQAAASKTLRQSTLSEVQHIKDNERKAYVATKTLDSERDANAILTEENEALSTRIEELEAKLAKAMAGLEESQHDNLHTRGDLMYGRR